MALKLVSNRPPKRPTAAQARALIGQHLGIGVELDRIPLDEVELALAIIRNDPQMQPFVELTTLSIEAIRAAQKAFRRTIDANWRVCLRALRQPPPEAPTPASA